MNKISRREFFTKSAKLALWLVGSQIWLPFLTQRSFARSGVPEKASPSWPDLAVVKFGAPEAITRKAVGLLGGMQRFVSKGDIVVVKPNIAFDREPEQAATTNPEVVAAVVKMAYEAGAKSVKVFDRPCNNPRRCYTRSGIEKAARDAGASVYHIENSSEYVKTKINGVSLKKWPIHRDVLECDCLINVPIAKHHGSAELTLSMKNLMGVVGGKRARFHIGHLHRWIADLSTTIKPRLIVIDAVRILTDHGPTGGDLADVRRLDTVIASVDPVAADSYAATLFGKKGEDIDHIRYAYELKLGEIDMDKLRIAKVTLK